MTNSQSVNGVNGVHAVNGAAKANGVNGHFHHLRSEIVLPAYVAIYNGTPLIPPGWTVRHHEKRNGGSIWNTDAVKFWRPDNLPRERETAMDAQHALREICPTRYVNANYLDHLLAYPAKLHQMLKATDYLHTGFTTIIFPGTRYIGPTVKGEILDFKIGREGREWGEPIPTGVSTAVRGGVLVRALVRKDEWVGLIESSKWESTVLPYPFDLYRDMRIALWA